MEWWIPGIFMMINGTDAMGWNGCFHGQWVFWALLCPLCTRYWSIAKACIHYI